MCERIDRWATSLQQQGRKVTHHPVYPLGMEPPPSLVGPTTLRVVRRLTPAAFHSSREALRKTG